MCLFSHVMYQFYDSGKVEISLLAIVEICLSDNYRVDDKFALSVAES